MTSLSPMLRIVTRTSALAMWQANSIGAQLKQHFPQLVITIIGIKTFGDKHLDVSLDKIGGKGVFVKELEQALLANEADVAVHSLKDMPAAFPPGLTLAAICVRENPFDAWICPAGYTLDTLPPGKLVGTSSLRRLVQLKRLRPDLHFAPLRGNIDTRLRKCQNGEYDAIVLAVAGLKRLNLDAHIVSIFSPLECLPAVGQGALGLQCRLNDRATQNLLVVLDDPISRACITAERAMNATLGGNCQVPVAGFATLQQNQLCLTGRVGHPDNLILLQAQHTGKMDEAHHLGEKVAHDLMAQGAKELIADLIK